MTMPTRLFPLFLDLSLVLPDPNPIIDTLSLLLSLIFVLLGVPSREGKFFDVSPVSPIILSKVGGESERRPVAGLPERPRGEDFPESEADRITGIDIR